MSNARRWSGWAYLAPMTSFLLACYAYPLYRNVELSLREYTVRSFVQGGAPFAGVDNYREVLTDPTFVPALAHTVVFTVASLVFQFGIGMALAVFFHQHFPLSRTLRALFLVPWLLPLIVSASTWSWMLNSDAGIVNAALGVIGIGPVNLAHLAQLAAVLAGHVPAAAARVSAITLLPAFGPGAAVGNLLVVMALIAGLVYVRIQRRRQPR